ncbi:mediator complex subunit 13 C-terminal-domain-containing protein, partial [Jimgerdemannia flammicorona]
MLTEASLTNILTVSGVTQIKYRCYRHTCPRNQLLSFIRSAPTLSLSTFPTTSSPSPSPSTPGEKDKASSITSASSAEPQDSIAAAYASLLASNVPCAWRFVPGGVGTGGTVGHGADFGGDVIMSVEGDERLQGDLKVKTSIAATKNVQISALPSPQEIVVRELWVFGIDEQQAALWDESVELRRLEETRSGSFSWETIFAVTASAPASPLSPVPRTGSSSTTTVSEEYQFFIIATRNLVERSMISRGALSLGDHYIVPSDPHDYNHPGYADRDITEGMLPTACHPMRETVLSCSFNVYLSSTNLVFQPVVRHLRVRPIRAEDLGGVGTGTDSVEKGKRVLLSPSGSIATLLSPNTLASPHDPAAVLREWSTFFGIPISKLKTTTVNSNIGRGSRANTPVPLLVPIKTATETLLYPSALIFISTPIKRSCNGVAGTTGLSANNSGLVEELGDKIDRWAWEDRIVEITSKKAQMGVGGGAPSNGNDAPATAGTKRTSDGADLMDAEFQPAKRVKIEPGQEGGEIAHVVGGGPGINPVHENIHPAPDLGVDYWQYSDPLSHITNTVLTQAAAPDPFGSPGFFQGALDSPGTVGSTSTTKDSPSRMPATPDSWFGAKRKSSAGIVHAGSSAIGGIAGMSPASMITNGVGTIGMIGLGVGIGIGIGMGSLGVSAVTSVSPAPLVGNILQPQSPEKLAAVTGAVAQMMRGGNTNGVPAMNEIVGQVQDVAVSEMQMVIDKGVVAVSNVTTTTPNTPTTMQLVPQVVTNGTADVVQQPAVSIANAANGAPVYPSPPDNLPDSVGISFDVDSLYNMSGTSAWNGDNYGDLDTLEITDDDWDFFDRRAQDPAPSARVQQTDVGALPDTALPANLPDDILQNVASTQRDLLSLDLPKDEEIDLDAMFAEGFMTGPSPPTNALTASSMPAGELSPVQAKTVTPGPIHFANSPEHYGSSSATLVPAHHSEDSPAKPRETINVEVRPYTSNFGAGAAFQFIPPDFAPLAVLAGVDDAKYGDGGKFVYAPPKKKRKKRAAARALYRPDYVPKPPTKLETKKKEKAHSTDDGIMSNGTVNGAVRRNEAAKIGAALDRMILSDSDSSSGSSSDSDSGSESVDSADVGKGRRDVAAGEINGARMMLMIGSRGCGGVKERLLGLHRQAFDVNDVKLEDGEVAVVNEDGDGDNRSIDLDYDSPFASLIIRDLGGRTKKCGRLRVGEVAVDGVDNSGEAERWVPTSATVSKDIFLKTVDCLCQQAVMGGYPFAGGLMEIAGRGGEIVEGESTQVFVTRRRGMVQDVVGDMTAVPALVDDACNLISEFKDMLAQTFDPTHVPEGSQHTHHLSTPATVTIKGPLSIQQYYDLAETNQTQSKYGKYQVKKRKPMEPSLDLLPVPEIVVGQRDDWIAGSPHILRFWEKLRLEPYSSRKNVVYFVVYPQSSELEEAIKCFFKELGSMYETCSLGSHQPGVAGEYTRGLVPVQLLPESAGQTETERKTKSYMAACQKLGSTLGTLPTENLHVVIYMVNPFAHSTAYFDLGHCFTKLMVAFHAATMGSATSVTEKLRERLVLQLVPIEHVLRPTGFGGFLKFGLKEIAFSVYTKCLQLVDRTQPKMSFEDPTPFNEVYAPPFVLAKSVRNSIQFSLKRSLAPYPTLLDQNVFLHLAYCWSLDRRWFLCVWIDSRGELLEFAALEAGRDRGVDATRILAPVFNETWERTLRLSRRTGYSWHFVVGKLGLMYNEELQEWMNVVRTTPNVSIVCMDIDSPLQIYPSTESATIPPEGMNTPTSSGAPTPEAFTSTSSTLNNSMTAQNRLDVFEDASGETHALLLNHRVAFSKTRRRIIEGVLSGDIAEGGDENWMLPLASGYLTQTPVKSEAPNTEKFCLEPHSLE